jgi:hypothetical protein
LRDIAGSTAVDAAVLFGLNDTAERPCDEIALKGVEFGGSGGRLASGDGESVDEFEDEESREGAAQIADAMEKVSKSSSDDR